VGKRIFVIFKELSGAPAEFQLLPDGVIDIEGDRPARLDDAAARAVISDFQRRGNDMVIDYEHQTLKDVEAPAAGWIKSLVYRGAEGLWAVVEWTERAKQYLQNKEYRYFSPVMWVNNKDRSVARIENVALTNFPKINNLKPIMAKMSLEEARDAQKERSRKYGIAVKEGGHVTKPGEWESVPDDEFLDPVNYRYPCPDADQTRAAAAYWGRPDNQAQYSSEERAIINKRLDRFREKFGIGQKQERKEAKAMIEKLKTMLGLAADAAEEKIAEAVELLVNKVKSLETVVACKEVLDALGAKENDGKEEVLQLISGLKAPGDAAVELSREVATLRREIAAMKQEDLIALALKEGKTSPEELEKWGRKLALEAPEQFKLIVLSRPAGSVVPVQEIAAAPPDRDRGMDEAQRYINKLMGVDDETFKKYSAAV